MCLGYSIERLRSADVAGTVAAARASCGCVVDLVQRVLAGELKNGIALSRPGGHMVAPALTKG